jgi:hypothetical protein
LLDVRTNNFGSVGGETLCHHATYSARPNDERSLAVKVKE